MMFGPAPFTWRALLPVSTSSGRSIRSTRICIAVSSRRSLRPDGERLPPAGAARAAVRHGRRVKCATPVVAQQQPDPLTRRTSGRSSAWIWGTRLMVARRRGSPRSEAEALNSCHRAGGSLPAGILFDLDDTLLDFSSSAERCWDGACRQLGGQLRGTEPAQLLAAINDYRRWFWSDPARHRRGRLDLAAARREVV